MTSDRRCLLGAVLVAALTARSPARAQPAARVPRVGVLWFGTSSTPPSPQSMPRFRARLVALGHVEGKTFTIEERFAERDMARLHALAREFVASGVDVIVTPAVAASMAARQATSTIPIVMLHAGNPVGAGLIASLSHPGGNVTGTSNLFVGGKQVQLFHEMLPRLSKLAMLVNPSNAGAAPALTELMAAARGLNIAVTVAEVLRVEDFANAFQLIRSAQPDGLFVLTDPLLDGQRTQIVAFAAQLRLPLSSDGPNLARAGGLMSYGPDFLEHYTMGADYVDRILKGAKPAELPVQLPRKFDFVINRKTAKALGLIIPQALLLRADEVIQ